MNKERLDEIQETIERIVVLAEVSGGFTSHNKKFIDLWNYTMELQDRINKAIEFLESLDFYKFTYPLDALDYDKNHLLKILKGGNNE